MQWHRLWQHLSYAPRQTRRLFPPAELLRLTDDIAHSELQHRGELKLVIEGSYTTTQLLADLQSRARAIELFGRYQVWDTEDNTGVLIYLLLAEHRIEIVADRGIARQVPQTQWDAICSEMQQALAQGKYIDGLRAGMLRITALLAQHFPAGAVDNPNELCDAPIIL